MGERAGTPTPVATTTVSRGAANEDVPGVHGGLRDPLPEMTHGLRSDEEKTKKRLFGGRARRATPWRCC
jgi:hypothetical protein